MRNYKPKPIRCEFCRRPMQPGDEYFVIDGKIVCSRFDCGTKAGRWEIKLIGGKRYEFV